MHLRVPHWAGPLAAVLALALDQVSKHLLIDALIERPGGIVVLPVFNLVMVWNRGVSFGLFNSPTTQGWIFIGLALVMVAVLAVWMARVATNWIAVPLGLIVGGALGNALDRYRLGAVADFFDFHLGAWHFAAFNVADSAICTGVGLLLLDALFSGRESAKQ
ncbi:MAG TPA: signal peptidase II [Candidatus Sulfotelmatobacter sp.]|nr:signal peptidase II [Candidatus Sulfotelmatobacter sp.]